MENVQISPTVLQPCQILLITNDELPIKPLTDRSFLPMTHQFKKSQKIVSVISARQPQRRPEESLEGCVTHEKGANPLTLSCDS